LQVLHFCSCNPNLCLITSSETFAISKYLPNTCPISSYNASNLSCCDFASTASFAQNVYAPSFITYTGGTQTNSTTTLADVHSSAGWDNIAVGFYEFEIITTYNVPITTTGARFSISGSTTQLGNNSLLGNTLLSGSIGIVGNSTLTGKNPFAILKASAIAAT
jgi:hypothetical protein